LQEEVVGGGGVVGGVVVVVVVAVAAVLNTFWPKNNSVCRKRGTTICSQSNSPSMISMLLFERLLEIVFMNQNSATIFQNWTNIIVSPRICRRILHCERNECFTIQFHAIENT
jgi:hypothetical protein